jgi:very-short-patch-repair endonuclease
MMRVTTKAFIEKARRVHGDRYDYSKVDYRNARTKVTVSCREHGDFQQTPDSHGRGIGCPTCGHVVTGKKRRLSQDEFIEKARAVHGELYDYSATHYSSSESPVEIRCLGHGVFRQAPNNHLYGRGCPQCGRERTARSHQLTTEKFVAEARAVHGGRYDYAVTEYVGSEKKVDISCRLHGIFRQIPSSHLQGVGCPRCAGNLQMTTAAFIEKARLLHGDRYDYAVTDYITARKKVNISCRGHGIFRQAPYSHLTGYGCPKCGRECTTKSLFSNTEKFVAAARAVHGDLYDYAVTQYVSSDKKVEISCREHGVFRQIPSSHLNGCGCPKCKNSQGEKEVAAELDRLRIHFERQVSFSTLRHKKPLRFDFCIPDFRALIEFDGEQHFKPIPQWGGHKGFAKIQLRDEIKRKWAAMNGYTLIRIRYDADVSRAVKAAVRRLQRTRADRATLPLMAA